MTEMMSEGVFYALVHFLAGFLDGEADFVFYVPVEGGGQTEGATRGLWATDHVILNHGQVTWTTPELAPPLLTTTPHQREDVSALNRFNVHRCPKRRLRVMLLCGVRWGFHAKLGSWRLSELSCGVLSSIFLFQPFCGKWDGRPQRTKSMWENCSPWDTSASLLRCFEKSLYVWFYCFKSGSMSTEDMQRLGKHGN
ncbi:uncharacterized protein TNCV_4153281 [Trichonephila clavipes]|nr:uncharacterized protein TNCV_4153281 [Trichonephila clavipes]